MTVARGDGHGGRRRVDPAPGRPDVPREDRACTRSGRSASARWSGPPGAAPGVPVRGNPLHYFARTAQRARLPRRPERGALRCDAGARRCVGGNGDRRVVGRDRRRGTRRRIVRKAASAGGRQPGGGSDEQRHRRLGAAGGGRAARSPTGWPRARWRWRDDGEVVVLRVVRCRRRRDALRRRVGHEADRRVGHVAPDRRGSARPRPTRRRLRAGVRDPRQGSGDRRAGVPDDVRLPDRTDGSDRGRRPGSSRRPLRRLGARVRARHAVRVPRRLRALGARRAYRTTRRHGLPRLRRGASDAPARAAAAPRHPARGADEHRPVLAPEPARDAAPATTAPR